MSYVIHHIYIYIYIYKIISKLGLVKLGWVKLNK